MAEPIDIAAKAARPKSTNVDGTTTVQRDISELVEANRAVAGNEAAKKPGLGLRRVQFINRGTT